MKALVAAIGLLLLSAGSANARFHPSLDVLTLAPPTFRGSGFAPHERVTVSLSGLEIPRVHVVTNARGQFRARLAAVPACRAWTVRAVGARGERAVYRHSRCRAAAADVEGTVTQGPITPICVARTPCYGPAAGVTVKAFAADELVAETTTDREGRFTLSLDAGYYTVAVGRGTAPQAVHVTASNLVQLAFLIDTGIR
jgi:hypothetical protein